MKRRRREREAREAQMSRELGGQVTSPQIKASKTGLPEEYKQEVCNISLITLVNLRNKALFYFSILIKLVRAELGKG